MGASRAVTDKSNFKFASYIKLNQSGQFLIEYVLLMIVVLGLFLFVTNTIREKKSLVKFTNSAVTKVQNMSQFGTWKDSCKPLKGGNVEKGGYCHPNSINRGLSSNPE